MEIKPDRFAPNDRIRGVFLRTQLRRYLVWEPEQTEARMRHEIVAQLKEMLGDLASPKALDRDWDRLAEASLTIGSKALNIIEMRLRVVMGDYSREAEFDFRAVAHQIHSVTVQVRKLKNAAALRKKCANAVLSALEDSSVENQNRLLDASLSGREELARWAEDLFRIFADSGRVNPRFLGTYHDEWESFSKDAFNYLLGGFTDTRETETGARYEQFLHTFIKESQSSKINWRYDKPNNEIRTQSDFSTSTGITIDLKKRPEFFAFIIGLPKGTAGVNNLIPLELMSALEQHPGFHAVDINQTPGISHVIEIQIHDKYTMNQIGIAQDVILNYLHKVLK
jgi:hypothetical protein